QTCCPQPAAVGMIPDCDAQPASKRASRSDLFVMLLPPGAWGAPAGRSATACGAPHAVALRPAGAPQAPGGNNMTKRSLLLALLLAGCASQSGIMPTAAGCGQHV